MRFQSFWQFFWFAFGLRCFGVFLSLCSSNLIIIILCLNAHFTRRGFRCPLISYDHFSLNEIHLFRWFFFKYIKNGWISELGCGLCCYIQVFVLCRQRYQWLDKFINLFRIFVSETIQVINHFIFSENIKVLDAFLFVGGWQAKNNNFSSKKVQNARSLGIGPFSLLSYGTATEVFPNRITCFGKRLQITFYFPDDKNDLSIIDTFVPYHLIGIIPSSSYYHSF